MGKFKLEDYEPVEDRLKRFWADHPDWAVLTTLESDVSDIKEVIYKSSLVDEKGHIRATGWAHETQGEGFVNTTSHIENCETSAIGRALANLGYQGSKRPSREEMEKVERQNKATEEGKQAQANIQGKIQPRHAQAPLRGSRIPSTQRIKQLLTMHRQTRTVVLKRLRNLTSMTSVSMLFRLPI